MTASRPLTIVIPTHNRAATLQRCLSAIFHQQHLPSGTDIIVVDDGSSDETRAILGTCQHDSPIKLTYLHQAQSGPAAARNRGLRHAGGRLVLFLGDDIIAEPTLVAEHVAWHDRFPEDTVAVLGFVTWSTSVPVTPYMKWLEASGNQFDYGRIAGKEDVDPARFLYTSNLSLKRDLIVSSGTWFDERFRHAMLEDIDLGQRLATHGLRLKFNPKAVAFHEHAVTLDRYVRRIETSSEYWVLLERKRAAGESRPEESNGVGRARRDYLVYGGYLARVGWEVARNWPYWLAARFFERRRIAPTAFTRAHRHWAQRGLLRLEAHRAWQKIRTAGHRAPARQSPHS